MLTHTEEKNEHDRPTKVAAMPEGSVLFPKVKGIIALGIL